MLRTTETEAAVRNRISPRFALLTVLPVLLLLAAMAPASAMAGAGGGGGTSGPCEATVTSTQDRGVAAISIDCGDGNNITSAEVRTSEPGSIDERTGTSCREEGPRRFTCSPDDPGSLVTLGFDADSGDVCASPRLNVDFTVELEDESTEDIDDVVVANCSDSSGSDGSSGEDNGTTPEGGVDSGAGGTAQVSSGASGAALPLTGVALAVLAIVSAGLLLRKTRTTP
jgi:hypothetical protein